MGEGKKSQSFQEIPKVNIKKYWKRQNSVIDELTSWIKKGGSKGRRVGVREEGRWISWVKKKSIVKEKTLSIYKQIVDAP